MTSPSHYQPPAKTLKFNGFSDAGENVATADKILILSYYGTFTP